MNASPETVLVSVLVASLAGSLHCAGMCGAFVAFAVGAKDGKRLHLQLAYHGGRLISYTALGAAAGALGSAIDLGGSVVGISRVAALLAAATLIVVGFAGLARAAGKTSRTWAPRWLLALARRAHELASKLPPTRRALAIGLLTTLLPCGWLYLFVVAAAGTANAALGAALMGSFWLGTVPVLASLGAGVQFLLARLGRFTPAVMSLAIILAGLGTILWRGSLDVTLTSVAEKQQTSAEGDQLDYIEHLPDQTPPCCELHDDGP